MCAEIKKFENKVGIFYSHNKIDGRILDMVIDYLNQIIEQKRILIVASSYLPLLNFKGINLISKIKTPGYLCIIIQILQCLIHAKKLNSNCKFVSLLEHDILYPIDYFDYDPFDENVVCNINYVQLSAAGFEKSKGGKPLSQLVMKFDFAVDHFHKKIIKIIEGDLKLEPRSEIYGIRESTPPLHFRHANYMTSHFNTFDKKYYSFDQTWGNKDDLIRAFGTSIL